MDGLGMVDVSDKNITVRVAIAHGTVILGSDIIEKIKTNNIPKGNILETSRVAGIFAAKKTSEIIPLCHNLGLDKVKIKFDLLDDRVLVTATVKACGKTGVEMESLSAVSVACLTIYDMCKMFKKDIVITDIELLEKKGGKSGEYIKS